MTKKQKFPPGQCIHCLKHFEELTSDHVFPDSWYPDNHPPDVEKWQAPSCEKCNSEYSKIEDDLLRKIGMCVNPTHEASSGIAQKALRSVNLGKGRNTKDIKARAKTREKLDKHIIPESKVDYQAVLPTLQSIEKSEYAVYIPQDSLIKMGIKFIRGINYVIDKQIINDNYNIEIIIDYSDEALCYEKLLSNDGKNFSCGLGIIISRTYNPYDSIQGVYRFGLWQNLFYYGKVTLKK